VFIINWAGGRVRKGYGKVESLDETIDQSSFTPPLSSNALYYGSTETAGTVGTTVNGSTETAEMTGTINS